MITSSSIQYITEMLNEPQNITAADAESIKELTETYPYFVPARYMEAAQKHKEHPYSAPVMSMMQLYTGNWLLYADILKSATNGEDAVFTEPAKQESVQTVAADNEVTTEEVPDEVIAATEKVEEEEELEEPTVFAEEEQEEIHLTEPEEAIILPIYTEDYFLHQGMHVSNKMPPDADIEKLKKHPDEDKSLMVVMSFAEWLMHFKTKKEKDQEEVQDQKALKTMWQKEKLAAAMEEENEEIPESVFKMAVNSITKEDDLASESFAEVYARQGRYDKAIDMYRKLSLRNPQKKAYFARKIEAILKEKQS